MTPEQEVDAIIEASGAKIREEDRLVIVLMAENDQERVMDDYLGR